MSIKHCQSFKKKSNILGNKAKTLFNAGGECTHIEKYGFPVYYFSV